MSSQVAMPRRRGVPDGVESPTGKLVCVYLDAYGETTLRELTDELELRRLTVLGILDTLRDRGVVRRDGDRVRLA